MSNFKNGIQYDANDFNAEFDLVAYLNTLASHSPGKGSALVADDSGATVHDLLPIHLQFVNYADLRNYSHIQGVDIVQVTGDGIAGIFKADPSDTTTEDNGGTVIVANDGTRWKRQYTGAQKAAWWGDLATAAQYAVGPLDLEDKTWTITATLTVDYTRYWLIGDGATIDATALTTGRALQINGPTALAELYKLANKISRGIELVGSGNANGVTAIRFGTVGGATQQAHLLFTNWDIHGFQQHFDYGDHTYLINFKDSSLYDAADIAVYPAGLTDSGENISFTNCTLFNSAHGIISNGGEFYVRGGSMDYLGRYVQSLNGANVVLDGVHVEGNGDTTNWFDVQNSDSVIAINNSSLAVTANKTTYHIGYGGTDNGGIFVNNLTLLGNTYSYYGLPTLFAGNAYGKIGYPNQVNGSSPVLANALNSLIDGGFEAASLNTVDWTRSGSTSNPSLTTSQHHSGTQSLQINSDASSVDTITHDISVRPGESVAIAFYALFSGTAANPLNIFLDYRDNAGNILNQGVTRSIQFGPSNNTPSTWTLYTGVPYASAPPGTAKARLRINNYAASRVNGNTLYIDDLVVAVNR